MTIEKGTKFPVLDHGYVIYEDSMGKDEDVVIAARQSTGRRFEGWEPGTICKVCRKRADENPHSVCLAGLDDDRSLVGHTWIKTDGDAKLAVDWVGAA